MVLRTIIMDQGVMRGDGAAHALKSAVLMESLLDGAWFEFLFDVYSRIYWPPFYSILTALAFTIFGLSDMVARAVSFPFFVFFIFSLIYLSKTINKNNLGFVAALMAIFCPEIVALSTMPMIETTALFFFTIALAFSVKIEKIISQNNKVSTSFQFCFGLLISLLYLTKSHYAIILILAQLVHVVTEGDRSILKVVIRDLRVYSLTILGFLCAWFIYPPKAIMAFNAMVNVKHGVDSAFSAEALLFYPISLLGITGLEIVSLLVLVLSFWSLIKNKELKLLAITFFLQILIAEVHQTKVSRHIMQVYPCLFIAFDCFILKINSDKARQGCLYLFVLALIVGLYTKRSDLLPRADFQYDKIVKLVPKSNEQTLLVSYVRSDHFSVSQLDCELVKRGWIENYFDADTVTDKEKLDKQLNSVNNSKLIPDFLKSKLLSIKQRNDIEGSFATLYAGYHYYRKHDDKFYDFDKRLSAKLKTKAFNRIMFLFVESDGIDLRSNLREHNFVINQSRSATYNNVVYTVEEFRRG